MNSPVIRSFFLWSTLLFTSTSMRGVTRTGSFGRVDTLRTSNPPSRSSSFSRGEKLPPSFQRLPPLTNTSATLPRDAERRSRSSGCGGDYVTVLEIGSSSGGGGTEVRSRTVPRTRPSGGYERTAGGVSGGSSRPVSRSNSQGSEQPLF